MEDMFTRRAEGAGNLGGQVYIAFTIDREILLSASDACLVRPGGGGVTSPQPHVCKWASVGDPLATKPFYHTAPYHTTR